MNQCKKVMARSYRRFRPGLQPLVILIASVLLGACGGGEEDPRRIPLPPGASNGIRAHHHQPADNGWGRDAAGPDRSEGLRMVKQLKEQCFTITSGDGNFWWCAAGTYYGVDAGTGQACSTTLTADGHVSFRNGSISEGPFKLDGGGRLEGGPAGGQHWKLLISGKSGFGFKRFTLTVDTSKSDQIRIHQYKRNLLSTVLDNTCITQF